MRRGSIAIGQSKCDNCSSTIEHGQQYLLLQEENASSRDGAAETSVEKRYCLNCCIRLKYASKKKEKGEEVYSFFV